MFLWATEDAESKRGVSFNQTIQVLNADNSITERQMNINGGFYDCITTEKYEDDSDSIQLNEGDDDSMTFLDAVQNEIGSGDDSSAHFYSARYGAMTLQEFNLLFCVSHI
jgi:hypothetical protein